MPSHTIDDDRNTQLVIDTSNATWTIGKYATLTVADTQAILIKQSAIGNTLNVLGEIINTGQSNIGIYASGSKTTVNIGEFSRIHGSSGVYLLGASSSVDNHGIIDASGAGIDSTVAATIKNSGYISGGYGIIAAGGSAITNDAGGKIVASTWGINFNTAGTSRFANDGIVDSQGSAIVDADGRLKVLNHGKLIGDVFLNGGNDIFDTRQGTVTGSVNGGDGDDVFLISKASINILEDAGKGSDTVKSTVSATLAANIEALVLLGKTNIDGEGNELDNHLTGNKGNNKLIGDAGLDYLNGGKGSDILTGGDGQDNFIFAKGNGVDRITDFTAGMDYVEIKKFSDVKDFDALSALVSQHKADTWIAFGDGDTLVIKGFDHTALTKDDFVFG